MIAVPELHVSFSISAWWVIGYLAVGAVVAVTTVVFAATARAEYRRVPFILLALLALPVLWPVVIYKLVEARRWESRGSFVVKRRLP